MRYGRVATPAEYKAVYLRNSCGPTPSQTDDETPAYISACVAVAVCILFLFIIGMAANYGMGGYQQQGMHAPDGYSNDRWWCYHCSGQSCTSMCWVH